MLQKLINLIKKDKALSLALLTGIILLIFGIFIFHNILIKIKQEKQKPNKLIYNVKTINAKKSLLTETIHAQAILEGNPQVKVYPNNINGIFIRNAVKEGDYVYKDQDIAYLDRNVPGSDFMPAPIKSPINGTITKLYFIDRGANVSFQQPIAEVANINSLKIVVTLGEKDLLKVNKGQPVSITSDYSEDININTKIDSVTPTIDSDSFAGNVIIYLDNQNRKFKIGMTVNVEIEVAQRMAYVVPESTILMGQNKTYLYVNSLQEKIDYNSFNKEILAKLKDNINKDKKNDIQDKNLTILDNISNDTKKFLLSYYLLDTQKKYYVLKDGVDQEAKKKILKILSLAGINTIAREVVIQTGFSKSGQIEINGDINDDDEIITDGNFKLNNGTAIKVSL